LYLTNFGAFAVRAPELIRSDGYQRNIGVTLLGNVMMAIAAAGLVFVLAVGYLGMWRDKKSRAE
jgi:hypothetical protein